MPHRLPPPPWCLSAAAAARPSSPTSPESTTPNFPQSARARSPAHATPRPPNIAIPPPVQTALQPPWGVIARTLLLCSSHKPQTRPGRAKEGVATQAGKAAIVQQLCPPAPRPQSLEPAHVQHRLCDDLRGLGVPVATPRQALLLAAAQAAAGLADALVKALVAHGLRVGGGTVGGRAVVGGAAWCAPRGDAHTQAPTW